MFSKTHTLQKKAFEQARLKLTAGLPSHRLRLEQKLLDELLSQCVKQISPDQSQEQREFMLIDFLQQQIIQIQNNIYESRKEYAEFSRNYAHSASQEEQQQTILDYARKLGRSAKALRGDKKAFARWFGRDAMDDRYAFLQADKERRLTLYLDRLGHLAAEKVAATDAPMQVWRRISLEEIIQPLLAYDGDNRVQVAAFNGLSEAVRALPDEMRQQSVSDATLQYIYRTALDHRQEVWLQREALVLLQALSLEAFVKAIDKRLHQPQSGDDLFVRRKAVHLIGDNLEQLPDLEPLVLVALHDSSAFVRQAVIDVLIKASHASVILVLDRLLIHESDPAVRASALLSIPQLVSRHLLINKLRGLLVNVLEHESDSFVLHVAIEVTATAYSQLLQENLVSASETWINDVDAALKNLQENAEQTSIRRWSSQARETMWFAANSEARQLAEKLSPIIASTRAGKRSVIPRKIFRQHDETVLLRTLSQLARFDHSLDVEYALGRRYVRRGHKFGFRLWRFLHELRHASSDKRQAHSHTIGRHFYGLMSAPSSIMGEQAETKVPGEPLIFSDEDDWRPYLPLVDQAISSLDQGWPTRPLRITTPEGVTELLPPGSLVKRLWARSKLTYDYEHFARLRNWQPGDKEPPETYLLELEKLGFTSRFIAHRYSSETQTVNDETAIRFFPAAFPLPFSLENTWQQAMDYFFSVYENTLLHLTFFVAAVSAYFITRHIWLSRKLRKARQAIPLVIGGWGTRGKSGTERLKAALMNALGYATVSKTTGCEAMFLIAPPFGKLREMYLFRPYEKATIWEQYNLVRLSQELKTEVFLWECMGLTPSYIHILQQDWMKDDIATITNTYPDHEDLQGPAGINIPQVMTNFIPPRSTLVTTEEKMLPILADAARERDTSIKAVGWLEAGLITKDILERFPYDEHPYNIALVTELAGEMAIEPDFALKEMADRVVLDLGVLRTYPVTLVRSRKLEFVMGMSANERFGALGNWRRMAFDQHDLDTDPDIWISTVINNRADRVARSRVFASMVVNDISADTHLLIGNNLAGLRGYIREAWEEHENEISLWSEEDISPSDNLQKLAKEWRIPGSESQLLGRLNAMLKGLEISYVANEDDIESTDQLQNAIAENPYAESLLKFWQRDRQNFDEYRALHNKLNDVQEADRETIDRDLREQLWLWLKRKLVIIEDYYATGNEVVEHIVDSTPPGLKNRIMGMQNIKGTGLDFVYRWQAWALCHEACIGLLDNDPQKAEAAFKDLSRFKEFGPLTEQRVMQSLDQARHHPWAQREDIQAEIELILESQQLSITKNETSDKDKNTGWKAALISFLENFLDAGDAVKRRKKADAIYKDLADMRIGQDRAALELQNLTKRQKGGWLARNLG